MKNKILKFTKYIINFDYLILSIVNSFIILMFSCLTLNYFEVKRDKKIHTLMSNIPVKFPSNIPNKSQDSVEIAIALFSIEIYKNIESIEYNKEIVFRGLTIGSSFLDEKKVIIGDMAFISWGILGSTIGHEAEIHGRQNFLLFEILNFLNIYVKLFTNFYPKFSNIFINKSDLGIYFAEKEAYLYELNSANRFNLNKNELNSIKNILENEI